MSGLDPLRKLLRDKQHTWLVTGCAGFIGSNLVEALLDLDQVVHGLDNFATGSRQSVAYLQQKSPRFTFSEGDIRDASACLSACRTVDFVLHQAALGSVPRSIKDPLATHEVNVNGFMNMLLAAERAEVKRFIFASSSSVYGDNEDLPKRESVLGTPLSPYAVTKRTGELYAETFYRNYGLRTIGLRYFNVFGRRQDPEGPYAAVLPQWVRAMMSGKACTIYGDGETSRDFCYIDNVIQANIRAALAPEQADGRCFNIAYGGKTTLNELYRMLAEGLKNRRPDLQIEPPVYQPFRKGDIRHSLADISAARSVLGYEPTHDVSAGLDETMEWYLKAGATGAP